MQLTTIVGVLFYTCSNFFSWILACKIQIGWMSLVHSFLHYPFGSNVAMDPGSCNDVGGPLF